MLARSQDAHQGTNHRRVLRMKISTNRVNHFLFVQQRDLVGADPVNA